MKISSFKIFIIIIFITFNTLNAQVFNSNELHEKKTIVFKLNQENRNLDVVKYFNSSKIVSRYLPKGLTVKRIFKNHTPLSSNINKYGQKLVDLSLFYEINNVSIYDINVIINQLYKLNKFEYVEIKTIPKVLYTPNDPFINKMYALKIINAYQAWDISQGDTNIVIGIIDTGTDIDHPDLACNVKYNYNDPINGVDDDNDGYADNFMGWDMGDNDNNPQVSVGTHGVFVAGLSSACIDNTTGIAGVGYNCKFLPIKAANTDGFLTKSYESIVYAADHGCNIINCSWGGTNGFSKFEQDIINYATINKDALVIAACGNDNNSISFYPASYKNVLSVANTDSNDVKFNTSSYGYFVDISAPGGSVYSTLNGGGYGFSSGTSFSAPIVAGCAALLRAKYPNYNALQIAGLLKVNADIIDTITENYNYIGKLGNGRVNILKALNKFNSQSIIVNEFIDNKNYFETKTIGDTVLVKLSFMNVLDTIHNTIISVESMNNCIDLIDSIINVSNLIPLNTFTNEANPFSFVINNKCNLSQEIWLKIKYKFSNGSESFEYLPININANYITMQNDIIKYSITGNGKIGYNNVRRQQGEGFSFNNSDSYLYFGGFVAGSSYFKVSDNIYAGSGYLDNDWKTIEKIKVVENNNNQVVTNSLYNDDSAGVNKMNIEVAQNTWLFKDAENSKYSILEFTLKNKGLQNVTNLYGGLYLDWDIANSAENFAKVDKSSKIAYIYNPYEGVYIGLTPLSINSFFQYAFDNNGDNSSINITGDNNGFSDEEKFISLRNNRDSAGYTNGNDVSHIVSYGPIAITPNDSIKLAYAIVVGSNLQQLKTNAILASSKYNSFLYGVNDLVSENNEFVLYPVPFKNSIKITYKSNIEIENIKVYDVYGNEIVCKYKVENNCSFIDVENNEYKGICIVELINKLGVKRFKVIRNF